MRIPGVLKSKSMMIIIVLMLLLMTYVGLIYVESNDVVRQKIGLILILLSDSATLSLPIIHGVINEKFKFNDVMNGKMK